MDQPETVIEPETAVEEALAEAAERVVAEVSRPTITFQDRFNVTEIIRLYKFGEDRLKKIYRERWLTCFSLAVSTGGAWVARVDEQIGYFGIFWRTKNVNINLAREVPQPDPSGNYVYIGWHWNESGLPLIRRFRDHMVRSCPGAEFIAGHDNRPKVRKARRGRVWVLKIPPALVAGERNGR